MAGTFDSIALIAFVVFAGIIGKHRYSWDEDYTKYDAPVLDIPPLN